jgi:hypothetical protein
LTFASNMRAKQSRLSIIGSCYRLPVSRRITEEFISLTQPVRFRWFWRHTFQDMLSFWQRPKALIL